MQQWYGEENLDADHFNKRGRHNYHTTANGVSCWWVLLADLTIQKYGNMFASYFQFSWWLQWVELAYKMW